MTRTLSFNSDSLKSLPSTVLSEASSALAGIICGGGGAALGCAGAPFTVIVSLGAFAFVLDVPCELLQLVMLKVASSPQTKKVKAVRAGVQKLFAGPTCFLLEFI